MTDWVAVFGRSKELLEGAAYIYHGHETHYPETAGKCYCLWTAAVDAYRETPDTESEEVYDSEDKAFVINVLRQAVGLEPQVDQLPDPAPVYAWNDEHTDQDVLAAVDRALELVTP